MAKKTRKKIPRLKPKYPVRVYLAAWRERLNLTQQEVGDRMTRVIDKGTISRWENLKRVPSLNVLAAYAEALQIPISALFYPPSEVSLDAMVAGKPADIKEQAIEMLTILTRPKRAGAAPRDSQSDSGVGKMIRQAEP